MKISLSLRIAGLLAILLSPAAASRAAAAEEKSWTGDLNMFLGGKRLEKDDWEPADKQGEFGVQVDFRRRNWPLNIAVDLLGAVGEGKVPFGSGNISVESRTSELNMGIRKIWDNAPHVRPFIGGGLSFARASVSFSSSGIPFEVSGDGTGVWLGGGVFWTLGGSFNIGFELKSSSAKARIAGVEVAAGGRHFGLLLGYHWGGAAAPASGQDTQRPGPGNDSLEIERQKLDLERQRLEVEKQKLELERQKLQEHGDPGVKPD